MRFATTLLLALTASGIGAYLFLDHSGVIAEFLGQEEAPALIAPKAKAITGLRLERAGDPASLRQIERREDGRWYLTAPVQDRVDPDWLQRTLKTVAELRATDFLPDPEEEQRVAYGLASEQATTLTIDLSDGQSLSYQVGRSGPLKDSSYLAPGGPEDYRGAFVAASPFTALAETQAEAMIDTVLARFEPGAITSLVYRHGDLDLELGRAEKAGSRWRLIRPIQRQADDERINAWLVGLATLPLEGLDLQPGTTEETTGTPSNTDTHTLILGQASPETPSLTLTFAPHPQEETRFRVAHSQRRLGYEVAAEAARELFPQGVDTLRERRLLRVTAADLTSITFTPQGQLPLQVEHAGTWLVKAADGNTLLANPDQGERFLELLNETEIAQYLQDGPEKRTLYGLEEPLYTVAFQGELLGPRQTEDLVMRVGMPPGDAPHVFVHFEGSDFIAAVSKTFLTGLSQAADPLEWKRLEVLNLPFEQIASITLERTGQETLTLEAHLLHEEETERLKLRQGERDRSADLNRHAAGQLLLDIGNLNADNWVSVSQDTALALTDPSLRVTVTSRASEAAGEEAIEAQTWRFDFTPVNPKVPVFYYGQQADTERPEPFLIKRALYERLSGERLLLEAPSTSP